MPLSRPALTLGSGPRGVHDARRWVVRTCLDIGRADLVECAELGVSEIVTNAVLHGEPPIQVRVRGTVEHPRIEVRDSSREAPILPRDRALQPDDDSLLTFGRGLAIVARASTAWGAEIEDDGKVVWFAPATDLAEDDGVAGQITGSDGSVGHRPPARDRVRVTIPAVPVGHYTDFQTHIRELRREVRLLALAHENSYPLAKTLSDLFVTLDRYLREGIGVEQIEAAVADKRVTTDLVVHMPRSTASALSRFVELLDLADEFCRDQRLLSLARTPTQRAFQHWFLTEFVRQADGLDATAWAEGPLNQSSVS